MKINESEMIDKYSNLSREVKKLRNMRVMVIPIVVGELEMVLKSLEKRLEESNSSRLFQRKNRDHPLYNIVKKNQENTQKNPGDEWRFAITQTPVENQQPTLVRKNTKYIIIIMITTATTMTTVETVY